MNGLGLLPHIPRWALTRTPVAGDNLPLYALALLHLEIGAEFWRFVPEPATGWTGEERDALVAAGVRLIRTAGRSLAIGWTLLAPWDAQRFEVDDGPEIRPAVRAFARGQLVTLSDAQRARIIALFQSAAERCETQAWSILDGIAETDLHP